MVLFHNEVKAFSNKRKFNWRAMYIISLSDNTLQMRRKHILLFKFDNTQGVKTLNSIQTPQFSAQCGFAMLSIRHKRRQLTRFRRRDTYLYCSCCSPYARCHPKFASFIIPLKPFKEYIISHFIRINHNYVDLTMSFLRDFKHYYIIV